VAPKLSSTETVTLLSTAEVNMNVILARTEKYSLWGGIKKTVSFVHSVV
jgi:hypothetical protein